MHRQEILRWKTTTTVALDFGRVTIDASIVLDMFGTPGQDRFGFMWNDLVDGAPGGLVLVDTDRIADCFVAIDYFEKIGLPFVVAVNQFEGRPNLGVEQVREAVNVDAHVSVVTVDARSRESMKRLVLTRPTCPATGTGAHARGGPRPTGVKKNLTP